MGDWIQQRTGLRDGIYFNRPNYKNTDVLVGDSKEDSGLPN